MKKLNTLIFGVLLIGLALFTAGCDATEMQLNPVEPTETVGTALSFADLSYDRTSKGFVLTGKVVATPEASTEGLTLDLYCDDKYVLSAVTGADGAFEMNNKCYSGDEAYIQTSYDSKVYESKHVVLTSRLTTRSHRSGSSGVASIAAASPVSGVPEFSILTLGVAVIVTTIGLVYLRKN